LLTGHPSFAGVTIRGTGQLVLIIDVPSLVEAKGSALVKRPVLVRGGEKRMLVEPVIDEAKKAAGPVSSSRAVRVLFVDDSVSVRKVAEMQLRALGAEVIVAVDGMDAMSKLRENQIDIVFTDLEMPRMHGYELIRELRFLPAYKDLPIIVVTSRSGQKHQDQARQLGASEYVTKPFTVQVLEAALKKWQRPEGATASSNDSQGTES
jgi:chemosensory pili system protein ChpA (sensor histidine kinase/response regulator)